MSKPEKYSTTELSPSSFYFFSWDSLAKLPRIVSNLWSSCLGLLVAGVTNVYHCIRPWRIKVWQITITKGGRTFAGSSKHSCQSTYWNRLCKEPRNNFPCSWDEFWEVTTAALPAYKYPWEGTLFFCHHDRALLSSKWQCLVLFLCDLRHDLHGDPLHLRFGS